MDEYTDTQAHLEQLSIRASVSSIDEEARTVELVWSTGASVVRRPWLDEPYVEELGLGDGEVRLERLNGGAPLLDSHASDGLERVLGVVERGWLQGPKGRREARAKVRFAKEDEGAERAWNKVRQRIVRNVSVGYRVHRMEETKPTKAGNMRRLRVTDWEPMELSLVAVGADPKAQVREDATADNTPHPLMVRLYNPEELTMDDTLDPEPVGERAAAPPTPAPAPAGADPALAERIRREERQRASGIRAAVRAAGLDTELADELIGGELSLDGARAVVLERLAEGQRETATSPVHVATVDTVREELDKVRAAVGVALGSRLQLDASDDQADRSLVGRGMLRLAEHLLEARGVRTTGMTPHEIARRSLMSTSDFPLLLANTANKRLRDSYEGVGRSFTPWTRRNDLPDFKPTSVVALSGMTALEELPEGGTIKAARMGDSAETYMLRTYARQVALTRQALVNDDLGGFDRILRAAGAASARVENNIVWALVTGNVTLADGDALFHANHGNLNAAAGGALSETSIGLAVAAMRMQTALASATGVAAEPGDAGDYLNLTPRWLIVPPALEVTARKLTTATTPAASGDVNAFASLFRGVIVEPRLQAVSAVYWYASVDPSEVDTVEWGYLSGNSGPMVELREVAGRDGVMYDVLHDFAAGVVDYRGLYRSDGAA